MAAYDVEEYKAFIQSLQNSVDTWDIVSGNAPTGQVNYTLAQQFNRPITFTNPDTVRKGNDYLYRIYTGIELKSVYDIDSFIDAFQFGSAPVTSNPQGGFTVTIDHGYGETTGINGSGGDGRFEVYTGSGSEEARKAAEYADGSRTLRNELLAYFKEAVGINDSDYQALWDGLQNNPVIMNDPALVAELHLDDFNAFVIDNFEKSFNYFLNHYDWTVPDSWIDENGAYKKGPGFNYVNLFLNELTTFFTAQARLDQGAFYGGVGDWAETENLVSYKTLYFANVPGATEDDYERALSEVYQQVSASDGYFLPSHHLKVWAQKVEQDRLVATGFVSKLAGNSSERTAVLLKLFALLVEVIETLQNVARAQAERLRFYAAFQKAYTDRIALIPMMNPDISSTKMHRGFEQGDNKNDLQYQNVVLGHAQQLAQAMQDTMRARRSVLGDEAKQHQTTVNQSNEMVTQQANLGTTLLQQMSTIITSMFK